MSIPRILACNISLNCQNEPASGMRILKICPSGAKTGWGISTHMGGNPYYDTEMMNI
jgi:hypothetical protein